MTDDNENVLDFGAFSARFRRYRPATETVCRHSHVIVDKEGGTVECDDCKKTISAHAALVTICEDWVEIKRAVVRQKQRASQMFKMLRGYKVRLRALKAFEQSWWRGNMLPCCPHCSRGLMAEDFADGASAMVGREYELKRREIARGKP